MMHPERRRLLTQFNCKAPVTIASLKSFEEESSIRLPDDYKSFLQEANGGEGLIGEAYAVLWPIEYLLTANEDYEVAEYAPGLFLFGTDGGGEAFAFDMRLDAKPIVAVPFVGMELKAIRALGPSFDEFLNVLYRGEVLYGKERERA